MTTRRSVASLVLTLLALGGGPGVAWAQPPPAPAAAPAPALQQLQMDVDVVLASRTGTDMDPQMQKLQETFQKQNFNFASFKRLTQQSLTVSNQASTQVKLPNGTTASLRLLSLREGTATLSVEVPQLSTVEVQLGRGGSVYQRAGNHLGGELILMLSKAAPK